MILRVKKRPFYREIGREWLAVNSRALGPRGYMRVEFCTCVNLHAIALWLYILSFSLRSRFHCEQMFDKMNKCITILLGLLVFLIRRVKQRICINAKSKPKSNFVEFVSRWPHMKPMVKDIQLSRTHRAIPKRGQFFKRRIPAQVVRITSPSLLVVTNDQ